MMKKTILILAMIIAVGFTFTSCKKEKKEEVKTEVEQAKEVLASNNIVHQCPMDCEKGKSYTEAGKCPVCKMDLVEKEVDLDDKEKTEVEKDSANHDGHDHD